MLLEGVLFLYLQFCFVSVIYWNPMSSVWLGIQLHKWLSDTGVKLSIIIFPFR